MNIDSSGRRCLFSDMNGQHSGGPAAFSTPFADFKQHLPAIMISALLSSGLLATAAGARTMIDPDPEASSTLFGAAIAVVGDIDHDGVPDLAVGAPFQDGDFRGPPGFSRPQNVGRVYVVSGRTLRVITQLNDPEFQMQQRAKFGGQTGSSIANVGDVNGDGVTDILVGVPHHNVVEEDSGEKEFNVGRAFLFSGRDGNVLLTLDDPEPDENARFGFAVARAGDVNGDGVPDLAVAAPFKASAAGLAEVGIVYILSGRNGRVLRELTPPSKGGAEEGGRFGSALANAGKIDGDQVPDILIGAPGRSLAFVYSGRTGAVIFTIRSPVGEKQPSFGSALAAGRDLNNDGVPDFAIGAPLLNKLEGVVYFFSGANPTKHLTVRSPDRQAFARFGASICFNFTPDGQPELLVGAPEQDVNGLLNAGEVFVFHRNGLFKTLKSTAPQAFAGFGYSLATADFDGDGLAEPVIGVPFQNVDLVAGDGDTETHLQIGQIELGR